MLKKKNQIHHFKIGKIERLDQAAGSNGSNGWIEGNDLIISKNREFNEFGSADRARPAGSNALLLHLFVVGVFLFLLIGVVLRHCLLALGRLFLCLVRLDLTLVTLLILRGQLFVLLLQVGRSVFPLDAQLLGDVADVRVRLHSSYFWSFIGTEPEECAQSCFGEEREKAD